MRGALDGKTPSPALTRFSSSSQSEFKFNNAATNEIVTYRFNDTKGVIERRIGSGNFEPVTAENVGVRYLKFYYSGNELEDGAQPRVTIVLGVSAKLPELQGNIVNLQTTVSSRQPDT